MAGLRENVLVIGGFDPSAGAGVLADVKTLEQLKVYGMVVNTANTVQSGDSFLEVNWTSESLITKQLEVLLDSYKFKYAKIGLVPSLEILDRLLDRLAEKKIKVVWDPVLKASAGFDMQHDLSPLHSVLKKVAIITPNWMEAQQLAGIEDAQKAAEQLAQHCTVYLKGGHNEAAPGKDYLYHGTQVKSLNPRAKRPTEKHGSGCVFASALTGYLALEYSLLKASLKAKTYISEVLDSNSELLGYHKK